MACTTCGKSAIEQIKAISTGIGNFIFENEEIERIAKPRLDICKTCTFAKVLIKVGDKIVLQCKECDCLCELKARVNTEVCPLNKW